MTTKCFVCDNRDAKFWVDFARQVQFAVCSKQCASSLLDDMISWSPIIDDDDDDQTKQLDDPFGDQ